MRRRTVTARVPARVPGGENADFTPRRIRVEKNEAVLMTSPQTTSHIAANTKMSRKDIITDILE